jgi:hypothetical protein
MTTELATVTTTTGLGLEINVLAEASILATNRTRNYYCSRVLQKRSAKLLPEAI